MTAPALAFNTDQGRYYRHPGTDKTVPSITNIKAKKHVELKWWAVKLAAEYAAENRAKLANLDYSEVYDLVRGVLNRKEPGKPTASQTGDTVHKWIEDHISGTEPTPDDVAEGGITAKHMYAQFLAFEQRYQPEYTLSEFTVWSDKHDYAGTGDLGMKIGVKHVLVDTKTGNNIYADTAMQLAAIQFADYILAEDGSQQPIPDFDGYGVLHLRPRGARLVPYYHIDEWFQAFLGLRELFRVDVEYSDTTMGHAPKISA